MTSPVRPAAARDQAWADLGAELTPVKSLARIDTATSRAVTTVTVVGVLLTGLGALSTSLLAQDDLARALAAAAVIIAALAVASALAAQVLTTTRRVNPANLADVKAWYQRQFTIRAYPTRAATILLLLAALLAGAAAAAALTTTPAFSPTIEVTQTTRPGGTAATSTTTVQVTFRGLPPGQVATVIVATAARVLARSAATPGPGGTAATALTVSHLAPAWPVTITARTVGQFCQAHLSPSRNQPVLTCQTT